MITTYNKIFVKNNTVFKNVLNVLKCAITNNYDKLTSLLQHISQVGKQSSKLLKSTS